MFSGEFGIVYKGYLKSSAFTETANETVAVKTLKGFCFSSIDRYSDYLTYRVCPEGFGERLTSGMCKNAFI